MWGGVLYELRQHLKEFVQRHREGEGALNTLIKINADISQVDGMFGTVYNTHTEHK